MIHFKNEDIHLGKFCMIIYSTSKPLLVLNLLIYVRKVYPVNIHKTEILRFEAYECARIFNLLVRGVGLEPTKAFARGFLTIEALSPPPFPRGFMMTQLIRPGSGTPAIISLNSHVSSTNITLSHH